MRENEIVYRYDGTLNGLMCCIFQAYNHGEVPCIIERPDTAQVSLFPVRNIETVGEYARRVSVAIHRKISPQALSNVRLAYLCAMANRELHILRFVRLGFEIGGKVMGLMADPRVDIILKAVSQIGMESHRYKQFVRFSDLGGVMGAEIQPKNFVLPLIASHFANRFSGESFFIYDKTHKAVLLYSHGKKEIIDAASFQMPDVSLEERQYRALWKGFYDAVAVEGRENPRCRMNFMPKRYWNVMTEFLESAERDAAVLRSGAQLTPALPPGRQVILE